VSETVSSSGSPLFCDVLITGTVITVDPERHVFTDGYANIRTNLDTDRDANLDVDAGVAAFSLLPPHDDDTTTNEINSPATARDLQYRLGQTPVDPDLLGEQMSLF